MILIALLWVLPGTVYIDPGATAYDNVDGNLTSSLSSFGIGSVFTSLPTGTSYFNITYTVQVCAQLCCVLELGLCTCQLQVAGRHPFGEVNCTAAEP